MAFCTNCGFTLAGPFCTNCGQAQTPEAATAAPPQGPQPQFTVPAPQGYAAAPPVPAKKSVWPYVLFGCLGVIVLGALGIIGTGYFVVKKVKQAGFDPELMQRNPAVAITKILAAANPEIEVMNVDESRGIITVRDKTNGKVLTLNFEDVKNGRIVFEEPGKGKVEIKGEGSQMQISTPEGTAEIGTGKMTLPAWIPKYSSIAAIGVNVAGPKGGTVSFTSSDSAAAVAGFYENAFQQGGLKVNKTTAGAGEQSAIVISAQGEGKSVNLTATPADGKVQVTILYESK
ncbi:MAG: hypothetical protein IT168_06350 [Bryobacterales bacterium]|nr:hypothetical protein [Bryobacterales bacterium]